MKWSKAKKQFELLLAPSLSKRVQVHVTEYTKARSDVGRGWITLDGDEVIFIEIPSFYDGNIQFSTDTMNFGQAIYNYLSLSIEDAIASNDAIINGFSFLDKRFGKRRLKEVDVTSLHPFSHQLYLLRCNIEGIKY